MVTTAPARPATEAELRSRLPGVTESFVKSQIRAKATKDKAITAWMHAQSVELEKATSFDELKKRWDALLVKKMRNGLSADRARTAVAKEHPQLRRDLVAKANQR